MQAAFNATNFCHWLGLSTLFVPVPFGVFCIAIISSGKSCCVHSNSNSTQNIKQLESILFSTSDCCWFYRSSGNFSCEGNNNIFGLVETFAQDILLDHSYPGFGPPHLLVTTYHDLEFELPPSCKTRTFSVLGKPVDSYTIETYTQIFQGY